MNRDGDDIKEGSRHTKFVRNNDEKGNLEDT